LICSTVIFIHIDRISIFIEYRFSILSYDSLILIAACVFSLLLFSLTLSRFLIFFLLLDYYYYSYYILLFKRILLLKYTKYACSWWRYLSLSWAFVQPHAHTWHTKKYYSFSTCTPTYVCYLLFFLSISILFAHFTRERLNKLF